MELYQKTFIYTVIFIHVVYVSLALGLFTKEPEYLKTLDFWVKVFTSVFLIWRFNPLVEHTFTKFDGKVAFSAGVFMATVTIVERYLGTYVNQIKSSMRIF